MVNSGPDAAGGLKARRSEPARLIPGPCYCIYCSGSSSPSGTGSASTFDALFAQLAAPSAWSGRECRGPGIAVMNAPGLPRRSATDILGMRQHMAHRLQEDRLACCRSGAAAGPDGRPVGRRHLDRCSRACARGSRPARSTGSAAAPRAGAPPGTAAQRTGQQAARALGPVVPGAETSLEAVPGLHCRSNTFMGTGIIGRGSRSRQAAVSKAQRPARHCCSHSSAIIVWRRSPAVADPVGELLLAGGEDIEELALVEPALADRQAACEPDSRRACVGIGDRALRSSPAAPTGGAAAGLSCSSAHAAGDARLPASICPRETR